MDLESSALEGAPADNSLEMDHEAEPANEPSVFPKPKKDTNAQANAVQPLKKSRKRKKQIYNAIRQQMEFYLGDANLSKDRFLKKLITDDPEIPLEVFMTFNKIKAQVSSVEEIEKAVSTSDKLRLSDDRKKVRRVTDFSIVEPRSSDECTIYVEALPTSATHEWVRKVFEQYGPVAYVSLPKFRTSHQIKEFAFVEFETRTSVLKAINSFSQFGGALNMSSDPDKLASITAYLREQETEGAEVPDEKQDIRSSSQPSIKSALVDPDSEPAKKKAKPTVEFADSTTDIENIPKASTVIASEQVQSGEDDDEEEDEDGTKKKVRRKKTTSKHHNKTPVEQHLDASINTLRITTKLEWKRLRNKYLNQQREKVKQMKKQLWLDRKPNTNKVAQQSKDGVDKTSPPSSSKVSRSKEKISRNPKKINFYGANKEATTTSSEDAVKSKADCSSKQLNMEVDKIEKAPLFTYEPGIIVKIAFNEPCVDVKDFKAEMRQHPYVRYVDVKEGDMSAYIRVDSSASAPTLVQHTAPLGCTVLSGGDEEAYWNKINGDRHQKISKQLKVKPKRGREKVAKVVANHMRFDD